MAHKFDPKNKKKLDNDWRRENLPPRDTLERLGLVKDDIVADLGCGIGYFTIPAAKLIDPSNKVYALDTSEEMLLETKINAAKENANNVTCVKTEEYDFKIDDNSVTFLLMVNVFHEVEDKVKILKEIYRVLKSGGHFALVDFMKKSTESGPPLEHRISKEEAKLIIEQVNFAVVKEQEFADTFYGVTSMKK